MIAIDTNVLIRLVIDDDAEQTRRARNLLKRGDILVSVTVLLEASWVLASAYRLDRSRVSGALRAFLGLEGVTTNSPDAVAQALDGFDAGLDFADALHLAACEEADSFVTFDERLVRKAKQRGMEKVMAVPR